MTTTDITTTGDPAASSAFAGARRATSYIEHPDLVAERIRRYTDLVGPERVMAGADCGFATFANFVNIDPAIAWAKFRSLTEGAHRTNRQTAVYA